MKSIEARDAGRMEAWKQHFEEKFAFAGDVDCPDDCHDTFDCEGPNVVALNSHGIKWECRKQGQTCGSCGQDIERDPFYTDTEGNKIGWPAGTPGNFEPNDVKEG
ncbi:MAG: hypothetical protein ACYTEQ_24535 [Planctomycetota bacterium]|jgi:hypothetical protein